MVTGESGSSACRSNLGVSGSELRVEKSCGCWELPFPGEGFDPQRHEISIGVDVREANFGLTSELH